jgi:hypothetical protein
MKACGGNESSDPIVNPASEEFFDFQQLTIEESSGPNERQTIRDNIRACNLPSAT